jgi:hypothetical protein
MKNTRKQQWENGIERSHTRVHGIGKKQDKHTKLESSSINICLIPTTVHFA